MDEEDRERLRLNTVALEQDLDVKDILPKLYEKHIISENDWDVIMAIEPKTRLTRTRELLKLLPKCGKDAYTVFRDSLSEDFPHLVELLDETNVVIVRREDWLRQIPDDVKNRPPTEVEFSRLAGCLGENWEHIGSALGLTAIHLQQLKMQHTTNHMPTLIYKMFSKWRGVKGKAATWLVFLTALIDCNVNPSVYESVINQQ